MELEERARKSLNKSIETTNVIAAKSYALDSIAASLILIADRLNPVNIEQIPQSADEIELMVRRLIEGDVTNRKTKTAKKSQ